MPTYPVEMENKYCKSSTELRSCTDETIVTSTAVVMFPTISTALLTAKKTAVNSNLNHTDPAGYIEVAQGNINEILKFRNISREIQSLQMELDMTCRAAAQANLRFHSTLTKVGD